MGESDINRGVTSAAENDSSEVSWRRLLWSSWRRKLYVLLIVAYSLASSLSALYFNRTPENLTSFAAVSTCLLTLLVGVRERAVLQRTWARLEWSPTKKLLLAGTLGAAYVETEFEVWQHVFGASGIAANPNLLIDLLITMPWYVLMIAFLTVSLKHARPTLFQVLLLGGIYELMADGVLASILAGRPLYYLLGLPLAVPIYTITYSPIVALPVLAVWPSYRALWAVAPPRGSRAWLLFPCAAILIYGSFLFLVLFGH